MSIRRRAAKLISGGDPKPVVLDIRTEAEFSEGHLKDAVNIDFKGADFRKNLEKLDRGEEALEAYAALEADADAGRYAGWAAQDGKMLALRLELDERTEKPEDGQ